MQATTTAPTLSEFDHAAFINSLNWNTNVLRGHVAQHHVSRALRERSDNSAVWEDSDITTTRGTTIEVKSAGLRQTWTTPDGDPAITPRNRVRFTGLRRRRSAPGGATYIGEPVFRSQVYVFGLHADISDAFDCRDATSWIWWVMPRATLSARGYDSISLPVLERIATPVTWGEMAAEVAACAE